MLQTLIFGYRPYEALIGSLLCQLEIETNRKVLNAKIRVVVPPLLIRFENAARK